MCYCGDAPCAASCGFGRSVLRSLPPSGLRSLRNAPPQHITTLTPGTIVLLDPHEVSRPKPNIVFGCAARTEDRARADGR